MKKKPKTYTKAEIREIQAQAVGKCLTIMLAALMDEYDLEAYDLNLVMDRFSRYSEAVDNHDITLKKVTEIIEEKTGVVARWY